MSTEQTQTQDEPAWSPEKTAAAYELCASAGVLPQSLRLEDYPGAAEMTQALINALRDAVRNIERLSAKPPPRRAAPMSSTENTPGAPLGRAMTAEEFNAGGEERNGITVVDFSDDSYGSYGHNDPSQFLEAVYQYDAYLGGGRREDTWITPDLVRHEYWMNTNWYEAGEEWWCKVTEAETSGAFPVTVVRV